MVKHPVLFETFVRVETARQVWEQIKTAQPQKLYFYSNKGRTEKEGEIERNNEIRSWIKEIDWECDLHLFFRDECVDVYTSLKSSKDWIFSKEDTAIILEDDCVPSLSFFEFCDYFLDLYKNSVDINFISGNNYVSNFDYRGKDHVITRNLYHYGWATWKDRWEKVDFTIEPKHVINNGYIEQYFKGCPVMALYYKLRYKKYIPFIEKTKCWDLIKVLCMFRDGGYCVTPIYNLVRNVGVEGEHVRHGRGLQFETDIPNNKEHYKFLHMYNNQKLPSVAYDIRNASVMNQGNIVSIYDITLKPVFVKLRNAILKRGKV